MCKTFWFCQWFCFLSFSDNEKKMRLSRLSNYLFEFTPNYSQLSFQRHYVIVNFGVFSILCSCVDRFLCNISARRFAAHNESKLFCSRGSFNVSPNVVDVVQSANAYFSSRPVPNDSRENGSNNFFVRRNFLKFFDRILNCIIFVFFTHKSKSFLLSFSNLINKCFRFSLCRSKTIRNPPKKKRRVWILHNLMAQFFAFWLCNDSSVSGKR